MRISDWSSDVCSSDLAAFTALGARLQPLAVDGQGLDPAQLAALSPAPRLAMLTPSHQFPLGMTPPLARRLALLQLARDRDLYLVEDDSDCEYRYAGPPLQALQGLDGDGRVLYVGTFTTAIVRASGRRRVGQHG